ncbi:Hypothetical predicted protein [Paramuricea clavata]|uniref:Uncharacterized protein n=1 Tax=Paramuricea clavata TaxID=317549 RepID=A0A6S7I3T2_PARCT|nr:Hypothetical predicted protein [Paramuricea clavata]
MCPVSTEQSDFVYRQKEADDFLKKRSLEYKKNQEKDKICSVVLGDADNDSTKHIKPVSMSVKDYQLPPIELLRQRKIYRRPTPEYNYIMLDKSSPDKCQKTTDTPETLSSRSAETKAQLAAQKQEKRPRDDHRTHFTFGSDIQRYPNSEQHDQFVGKAPMDPAYPSAGKSSKREDNCQGRCFRNSTSAIVSDES